MNLRLPDRRWVWEVIGSAAHPSRRPIGHNGTTFTRLGAIAKAEVHRRRLTRHGYNAVTYTSRLRR